MRLRQCTGVQVFQEAPILWVNPLGPYKKGYSMHRIGMESIAPRPSSHRSGISTLLLVYYCPKPTNTCIAHLVFSKCIFGEFHEVSQETVLIML
jgi:hypothetical protein